MNWIIPGTVLEGQRANADKMEELFHSMFLAGGLSLGQVATVTGLEPYAIQNWVKRGFLPPPRHKRYNMEQLCRILNINVLRGNMSIEEIVKLMSYLNGNLADESDDLVDDTVLYFLFVKLAARARYVGGSQPWDDALAEITADFQETVPGTREKLCKVLKVMLTVWMANLLRREAANQIAQL